MARLGNDDLLALVDAVNEAHLPSTVESFPARAMRISAALVHSDITTYNEVDPSRGRAVAEFVPADWTYFAGAMERFAELQSEHPVIDHVGRTGDGSASKISDFWDRDTFHRSRIYRELYGRMDVEYQMSVTLPAALPRIVAIVLNRSDPSGDFDERDRTVLNLLRPHLAQAYEHARMRDAIDERLAVVGRILGEQGSHVIVLDAQISEATAGAMVTMYRYFGRPGRASVLPDRVARWVEDQHARVHHRVDDGVPQPFRTLSAVRDGMRLVMRFVPGVTRADAIVLSERAAGSAVGDLGLLGLSPREADVLRLLYSGATNAVIGEHLHISAGTVKKHLDNIYRKLGVSGRVQAVSMGLELLSGQGNVQH